MCIVACILFEVHSFASPFRFVFLSSPRPPYSLFFFCYFSLSPPFSLRLLLGRGGGLGGLLLVAADHDDAEEGADDGGADEDEDDGDADGPDARGEEVLELVVVVDEGLCSWAKLVSFFLLSIQELRGARGNVGCKIITAGALAKGVCWLVTYHEKGPDGVVEEDDRCSHEHGETDEPVQLFGEKRTKC